MCPDAWYSTRRTRLYAAGDVPAPRIVRQGLVEVCAGDRVVAILKPTAMLAVEDVGDSGTVAATYDYYGINGYEPPAFEGTVGEQLAARQETTRQILEWLRIAHLPAEDRVVAIGRFLTPEGGPLTTSVVALAHAAGLTRQWATQVVDALGKTGRLTRTGRTYRFGGTP